MRILIAGVAGYFIGGQLFAVYAVGHADSVVAHPGVYMGIGIAMQIGVGIGAYYLLKGVA